MTHRPPIIAHNNWKSASLSSKFRAIERKGGTLEERRLWKLRASQYQCPPSWRYHTGTMNNYKDTVCMYFWVSLVQFIGTKTIRSAVIIWLPSLFPFGNIDVIEFFFLIFSSILLRFLDITQAVRSFFSFFSVIVLNSTF